MTPQKFPRREVTVANRYPRLRLDRRAVGKAIAALDAHASEFRGGCPPGELSLVFLSDLALAKLHANFLADPTFTDVITFEGNPTLGIAGEICVSVDAALRHLASTRKSPLTRSDLPPRRSFPGANATAIARQATDRTLRPTSAAPMHTSLASEKSYASQVGRVSDPPFARELLLYLVHGWLHLAGYDDLEPRKKRLMRRAEAQAMKLLAGTFPDEPPLFRLVK